MKRAILLMTDFLVMDILKATLSTDRRIHRVIENALPDDVKIVRTGHDDTGTLRFMLESEEFKDIGKDEVYPELLCPVIQSEIIEDKGIDKIKYKLDMIEGVIDDKDCYINDKAKLEEIQRLLNSDTDIR